MKKKTIFTMLFSLVSREYNCAGDWFLQPRAAEVSLLKLTECLIWLVWRV